MFLLGLIILVPFALLGAAVLMIPVRYFRLVPTGVPDWTAITIITLLLVGGLTSAAMLDALAYQPIKLQQRYLGRVYASPLTLRHYDQGGFQDPFEIWVFAPSPAQLDDLRGRCTPLVPPTLTRSCSLFGKSDERWFISISLEGDRLEINEGLH